MANTKRMRNRREGARLAHREPEHIERGYTSNNVSHKMHGSPASIGASIGAGPLPGAGMTPQIGPGAAASRYSGAKYRVGDPNGSMKAPKGMRTSQDPE